MSTVRKNISFQDAPRIFAKLREEGKKIVQCHGTFDLLHPGHIIHFEEANVLGDILVVTITAEKYVNKGLGRPYFNDELRVKYLSSLEYVDYVVVVPFPAACEAIECVRPHIYCKGKEYEIPQVDVTGNIYDDIRTVERLGGRVHYVGSVVFSSTRLLNSHFEVHPPEMKEFCKNLAAKYSPSQFREIVDSFKDLKVLIIGDIIFDRYSSVKVQGLTSKNRIISARFLSEETQAGGALAVFRHVKQFTPNIKLVSLVGTEEWVGPALAKYINSDEDKIIRSPDFTTIIKQRFVEPLSEGKELSKLFAINVIEEQYLSEKIQDLVYDIIDSCIKDYDLVVVADFGHGLMQEDVRELVQKKAPFLALNCQTNSYNYGFNIIDKQYHHADSFSLDESELTLACGRRNLNFSEELKKMQHKLSACYGWLTRGATDTIGIKTGEPECECMPFEQSIVDTVGAGDAFCSVASLAAAKGLPIDLATFMGQLAGAQAVRIIGNADSIKKDKFLKGGMALLSF
ncbi:MAG: adenylyltransferase/cytidyltransferase family protein [Candidatus Omnitrophica bacterium]|nr:adenylyltransferase/cytidyltransferase family protein [Candidatus Omnitrophota bacterium]